MATRIDSMVTRATKDALLDAFPEMRSSHLSEGIAALFGFRTSVALKTAIADDMHTYGQFHERDAIQRLCNLTGSGEDAARAIVEVARAAAIAANVAGSKERGRLKVEAHKRVVAERKAAESIMPVGKYHDFDGKLVAFVVNTRHGKFKPFVGRIMDMAGDMDALVNVLGSQEPKDTLDEALAVFEIDMEKFGLILRSPVPSGGMMGHWLNQMIACQEETTSPAP